ncbi:MAG TPA: molecular chaperone DnaJ [Micromonosporaceae bacterium]
MTADPSVAATPLTFDDTVALLMNATCPADVFGAGHTYRDLAKLVHPDHAAPAEVARATAAFERLTALREAMKGTTLKSYRLTQVIARGDLANVYATADMDVVVKIGRDPTCSDLLEAEAAALNRITDERFRPYVPHLIESFSYREPGTGVQRTANVLHRARGFVSLAEVREAYPGGVDPRDAAWIWRRLLVAIGAAHRAGVIHGAVLPEHVLIEPALHGLMLIDWCYATSGAPVPALVERYDSWYPEEVHTGRTPGPGTDIHLATRCMVELMGGRIPPALAMFARGCTLPRLATRPDDAWAVLRDLDEALHKLYGPRTFRPFVMPEPHR